MLSLTTRRGVFAAGWRAGQYYAGRDSRGAKLQTLPTLMATPSALLLEDKGVEEAAAGAGAEGGAAGQVAHEALRFPALATPPRLAVAQAAA